MATKGQVNVIVKKTDKKRPTWYVFVVHHSGISIGTPGDFKTWWLAEYVARTLAFAYRESGYSVALDIGTSRKRKVWRGP